jgi:hypothetical protein
MAQPLPNNGLVPPPEFPTAEYATIFVLVGGAWGKHPEYGHFSAAWNALAYRFAGAFEVGKEFTRSLEQEGASPPPKSRFAQEQALYHCFSNWFSAFEAAFYAHYALGLFLRPAEFDLSTATAQQRVSPQSTMRAYAKAFAGDPLLKAFQKLFADPGYLEVRDIRNVLTHRTAPGRRMYVGIGSGDAPPVEWKLNNVVLNEAMVPTRHAALSHLLRDILCETAAFLRRNGLKA